MKVDNIPLRAQVARLRPIRLWPYLLVALGCTAVLSLLAFGQLHSRFSGEAMNATQAYVAQVERFDRLLTLVLDAENGVRGYLLYDRNPIYLEPYTESEIELEPLLARVAEDFPLTSESREEFDQLVADIAIKRQLLADMLAPGRTVDAEYGRNGKLYTDRIRHSIAALHKHMEADNKRVEKDAVQRLDGIQRTIAALALGALGLIIALFGVQQRQASLRARIAELLEHENEVLESTVAARTRELTDLASYLTNIRETEKARFAREMHDELGALLTAAKMDAGWLLRSLGGSASADIQARFRRLIDTIGSGITIKRRIIDDLRPPLLQGLGLVEALRALTEDLRGEYRLRLELPEVDIACPEEQSLALFRIVQESITNIRKYAHASEIEVGLKIENGRIRLWIADDGQGFDPSSPHLNHHGLVGMKHRTQMFEGEFHVISAPGEGARVEATMPLHPAPTASASIDDQAVA